MLQGILREVELNFFGIIMRFKDPLQKLRCPWSTDVIWGHPASITKVNFSTLLSYKRLCQNVGHELMCP